MRKIILLFLLFSVNQVSAQKSTTLYYKGNTHGKPKKSLTILSSSPQQTFVSFYNKELLQIWRKKTPKQINANYRSLAGISNFSYNSNSGYVKMAAPTNLIRAILKKEFEFSDKELTAKGL